MRYKLAFINQKILIHEGGIQIYYLCNLCCTQSVNLCSIFAPSLVLPSGH